MKWACRWGRQRNPTGMARNTLRKKQKMICCPSAARGWACAMTPPWWKSRQSSGGGVRGISLPKVLKFPSVSKRVGQWCRCRSLMCLAPFLSGRAQRGARWALRGAPPIPLTKTWHHPQGGCCRSPGCRSRWLSGPWTRTGGRRAPPWRTEWRRSDLPSNPVSAQENQSGLKHLVNWNLTNLNTLCTVKYHQFVSSVLWREDISYSKRTCHLTRFLRIDDKVKSGNQWLRSARLEL